MKITELETIRLGEFANILSGCGCTPTRGSSGSARPSWAPPRSRPTSTRRSAPRLHRPRSAADRGDRARTRSAISAGAAPASRRAAIRPSTSPCGTSSARRSNMPVHRRWAAEPRRDPHLQHLRRLPLHPRARAPGVGQLGLGARQPALRGPARLPDDAGELAAVAARRRHHGHEDLAVRHRRRATDGLDIRSARAEAALEPSGRSARQSATDGHHGRVPLAVALAAAERIARALEPFDTYWHEDPMRMDCAGDAEAYAPRLAGADLRLARRSATRGPSAITSRPALRAWRCSTCSWCGGLTEARKIAGMAEA